MKKKIYVIIIAIFLLLLIPFKVEAQSMSVDETTLEINSGENKSTKLYLELENEIKEINFTMITTTYDATPTFISGENINVSHDGSNYTLTSDNFTNGSNLLGSVKIAVTSDAGTGIIGNINIYNIVLILKDDTEVKQDNVSITVKVPTTETTVKTEDEPTKKEEKSSNTKLKSIDSEIVAIKLENDIYEYKVKVNSNVTELDLKAIVEDEKSQVTIGSQTLEKDKGNIIEIKVVAEDESEQIYKIIVDKKKSKTSVEIDDSKFKVSNNFKSSWVKVIIALAILMIVCIICSKKK